MDYTILALYSVIMLSFVAGENTWSVITAVIALLGLIGTVIGLYIKVRVDIAKIKVVQSGITHDLIELNEKIDNKMDSITCQLKLNDIDKKVDKIAEKQDEHFNQIIEIYKELANKKAG